MGRRACTAVIYFGAPTGPTGMTSSVCFAADAAALGAPFYVSVADFEADWLRPRFDPARDTWLIESGDGMVAYGEIWARAAGRLEANGVVHPAHTALGLGSALAQAIELRAVEHAGPADEKTLLITGTTTLNESARRLFEARGYRFERRFWHMELNLDDALEPSDTPGVSVCAMRPERDGEVVHRILESAFRDHWDHTDSTFEEFAHREFEAATFDPGLWLIAELSGEPAGVLSAMFRDDRGWIMDLGVLKEHRGMGIASQLLRHAFSEFKRRGWRVAGLNVDSESLTGASRLYEREGMHVVSSFDLFALEVRPRG